MEFIAEIGMNYNTNKGLIPEMVRLASNAGADYAKLQLGWRDKPGEINNLSKEDALYYIANLEDQGVLNLEMVEYFPDAKRIGRNPDLH